jgi:YVTN family beta-propeller protein
VSLSFLRALTAGRRVTITVSALGSLCAALSAGAVAAHTVYVTNEMSGDLTIIDGETREVIATVPLGKRPRGIQLSPDGAYLYVALSGSPLSPPGVDESTLPPPDKEADGIGVFSLEHRRIERIIRGVSDPEQLAVSRDGRLLFIASEDTGTAVIADVSTGDVVTSLPVGGEPEGVAIRPDGRHVYMTSEADHRVAVIDTESQSVVHHLEVGTRPRAVAFAPDGAHAFVTGELDASVAVIDTTGPEVVATMTVPGDGALPMGVAVAPDGGRLYVTTGRGGSLVAFDTATLEPVGEVEVGLRPWGVALSPDGRYAYTANGPSDDVSIVDTQTMTVEARIEVGTRPWGVLVVPAEPDADGQP